MSSGVYEQRGRRSLIGKIATSKIEFPVAEETDLSHPKDRQCRGRGPTNSVGHNRPTRSLGDR